MEQQDGHMVIIQINRFIKYQSEFDKSIYYKNKFETSKMAIDDFYKSLLNN